MPNPNLMIVLDGLEDISYPELGGKTPYGFGKGDAFRMIEAACATGRLATTPPGFEPDTLTCILTLLGVPPAEIPGGRTYVEALAIRMPVKDDDLVLRCNFVKVSPGGILEDPTCEAPEEIAEALLAEVRALPGNTATQVGGYKSIQRVANGRRFVDTIRTFPPHNYAGRPLEELLPSGNELAGRLAGFTREMLAKYAPYTVFNWAPSARGDLPAFEKLHGGMSGSMVSATHAPMGGAIAMGMGCPPVPTATGDTDTDLAAKVKAALAELRSHDFVMLHVGGPDEATHRRNVREKAAFVSKLDRELIAPILEGCPDGTRIMLTSDHVALCSTGGHTDGPVAFLLYEKGARLSGERGVLPGVSAVEILNGSFIE